MIECIFCGTREPRGKKGEDIISDWYAKRFHGPGDYTREMVEITAAAAVPTEQQRSQTVATLRLPDVCQHCNNTWMADIEREASSILTPMMQGTPRTLPVDERETVARWCQLKAVTLDARYPNRILPDAVAHAMPLGVPLRTLAVLSGKTRPDPGNHVLFARRNGSHTVISKAIDETDDGPFDGTPAHFTQVAVARFTFAFSQFAFQVLTWTKGGPPVEMLNRHDPAWISVWPPEFLGNPQISWPPAKIIDGMDGLRPFL